MAGVRIMVWTAVQASRVHRSSADVKPGKAKGMKAVTD